LCNQLHSLDEMKTNTRSSEKILGVAPPVTVNNCKTRCFILCEKKQRWICSGVSASTSLKSIILWDCECDQCAWVNSFIKLCLCKLLFTQYETTWLVRNTFVEELWEYVLTLRLSSDFWASTKRKFIFSAASFHNSSPQFLRLHGVLILVNS